jgi:hypothetical protein
MRLVLTAGLFGILLQLTAQPVVDGSNYTTASSELYYELASPTWLIELQPDAETGENYTWDYSDFQAIGEQVETFVNVSSVPFLYQIYFNNDFLYPNTVATHAQELGNAVPDLELPVNFSDVYSFFRNDESGYYIVGTAFSIEGLPLASPYDTTDRVFPFPLHFGDQDSTNSYFLTEVPLLGTFGQSALRYNHVDGWGSISTPDTTYEVLRIRTERYITDTVYIEQLELGQLIERPLQVDYTWVSPQVDGLIFEATVIGEQVVSGRMRGTPSTMSAGNSIAPSLKLYPNPASNSFRIEGLNGPAEVRIYTTYGKLLHQQALTGFNAAIDAEALPNGVFLIEITTPTARFTERMVVAR